MKDPFTEFRNTVTMVENRVQALAKAYDVEHLGGPQGFVTLYLHKHTNDEIFIKDIEKELRLSKSVTSNLIKRMEKNGFIQIVPSQKDKRYKQLTLTDFGREKALKLADFHEAIKKQILQGVSLEELAITKAVIRKIKENLENEE